MAIRSKNDLKELERSKGEYVIEDDLLKNREKTTTAPTAWSAEPVSADQQQKEKFIVKICKSDSWQREVLWRR